MVNKNPLKIGVVGVGHLGQFHVQQLLKISNIDLIGLYDVDNQRAIKIGREYSVTVFDDKLDLMKAADALCIVTPTRYHYDLAMQALDNGCDLFIEKPITETIDQAVCLLEKAESLNKIIQVGHIERFNPAFLYLKDKKMNPQFIEIHRLAPFNPRGTDVPVMLDLMIHDIDILLTLVQSPINDIRASGVKVVSKNIDIANTRISFKNGCVANLTASRISQGSMRKMRIFQTSQYTTIDFLQKSVETYNLRNKIPDNKNYKSVFPIVGQEKKYIIYDCPKISDYNALREELNHFSDAVNKGIKPEVDGHSGIAALKVALEIQKIIDKDAT